jgi:hypothetical protein
MSNSSHFAGIQYLINFGWVPGRGVPVWYLWPGEWECKSWKAKIGSATELFQKLSRYQKLQHPTDDLVHTPSATFTTCAALKI